MPSTSPLLVSTTSSVVDGVKEVETGAIIQAVEVVVGDTDRHIQGVVDEVERGVDRRDMLDRVYNPSQIHGATYHF